MVVRTYGFVPNPRAKWLSFAVKESSIALVDRLQMTVF
jgi:hypothetical protein